MEESDKPIRLAAGHVLTRVGEPLDRLYVIRSGRVALTSPDLRREIEFGPGMVIGLADVIERADDPHFRADVRVVEPAEVTALDARRTVRHLKALSPHLRIALIAMLRSGLAMLEAYEESDRKVDRMMRKAQRELMVLLERPSGSGSDAESPAFFDELLRDDPDSPPAGDRR